MENRTRMLLAVLMVVSVVGVGLVSIYVPSAREVFRLLLPALVMVFGYYFPRRGGRG